MKRLIKIAIIASAIASQILPAQAGDSHAGYYYPEPDTQEIYASEFAALPNASKRSRVGFTVGLNEKQLKRPYAPEFHMFAKGATAQKLIIVASGSHRYNTLYRLRALLAALTSEARLSPLFRDSEKPEELNFLDLALMIGFEQVTISDGDKIAHRITLR